MDLLRWYLATDPFNEEHDQLEIILTLPKNHDIEEIIIEENDDE